MSGDDIRQAVREKYGDAALRVLAGEGSSCGCGAITANLYDATQMTGLPEQAVLASLGCGNLPPWRNCAPARPCSISGQGAHRCVALRPACCPTGKRTG